MIVYHSKKIVYDYINGEEIDNIEELENDAKFMIDVINITRDKNMYNLCSNELKNNHEFVMYIIDTFKNDKNFIHNIALEYMNKLDSGDIRYKEICFVMSDIFNNRDDDRDIYYNLLRTSIYNSERVAIEIVRDEEVDEFKKKQIGLGFILVLLSDLGKSDIVTKYFAIKYLDEIFYEREDMSIDDLVHSRINSLDKLKKIGVKNFIIDYVRNYDVNLSDYLFTNINLINSVEKDINRIINNWDYYLENSFERRMDIFEQEVDSILEKYDVHFDFFAVCNYLDSIKLNISIKFKDYYNVNVLFPIDINKVTLIEYRCLQEITLLTKNLFSSCVIDKNYGSCSDNTSSNKYKNKVLKFKNNYN